MNTLQSTEWLKYGIKDIKYRKQVKMNDPLITFEPAFASEGQTLVVAVRESDVIRKRQITITAVDSYSVRGMGYLRSMPEIVAGGTGDTCRLDTSGCSARPALAWPVFRMECLCICPSL